MASKAHLEIYRENPKRRKECVYYLAIGEYKLGNYSEAKRHISTLLHLEPDNEQALDLERAIQEKATQEGWIGVGLASGAVIGLGVLLASVFSKRR